MCITLYIFFCCVLLRPPISTRTDALLPYSTSFRLGQFAGMRLGRQVDLGVIEHATEEPADVRARGLALAHRVAHAPDHVTAAAIDPPGGEDEIGRAHVRTPVTNAHLVCRLLLEKQKNKSTDAYVHNVNNRYPH